MINIDYVEKRFSDFIKKYRSVISNPQYKYSPEQIEKNVEHLQKRLQNRDFKMYGDKPIHLLQAGKRIVKNSIKVAISTNPFRKSIINMWREQYRKDCEDSIKNKPWLSNSGFFSFEAAYSKKLLINFSQHKQLLFL